MLVRNYCNKMAKQFSGCPTNTVCPVKDEPNLCPFGDMCWIHPAHTTPEIEQRINKKYEDLYKNRELKR